MANQTMKRHPWVRYRFYANPDDYRPMKFPPPGPYWCTGFNDNFSVVIAYLPKTVTLTDFWPEATEVVMELQTEIIYTDRFSKPEWWKGE